MVAFALGLRLYSPPNGVLVMVNTLAPKAHKSMHDQTTDEEMVGGPSECLDAEPLTTSSSSFLFSPRIQMGPPQRESSSWEGGTGAAFGGIRTLESCRSTSEWRDKKASARLLGMLTFSSPQSSDPLKPPCLQLSRQGAPAPLERLSRLGG